MDENLITYKGGCHCKKVQFECQAPQTLKVQKCNCSICYIKQNHHFIVAQHRFKLHPESEQYLTMYSFNTHQAKHYFCKICGVQPFYYPRSIPDGVGINVYSIELTQDSKIEIQGFDGQQWQQFLQKNQDIIKPNQPG